MRLKDTLSRRKGQTYEAYGTSKAGKLRQGGGSISRHDSGSKSRGGSDTQINAWAFSEASVGNRVREDALTRFCC